MIEHQDTIDFSHVPKSQGLNTGTKFILVIGVLMIFAIGGASVFSSGYNHMWPDTHTMRMDLGSMPK